MGECFNVGLRVLAMLGLESLNIMTPVAYGPASGSCVDEGEPWLTASLSILLRAMNLKP